MAMKYYNATQAFRTTNPTKAYRDDFVAISEQTFDNAPNVKYNEIEYEVHYGKRDFKPIPMVRVEPVVNYNTGIQVGDDYQVFIFTPDFPEPYYGMKFKWGRNYYLVINVDKGSGLSTSAEVRRCNNTLRFFDENGNKIYEPCILDQVLRFTNNNDTMTIVTGKAEQYIWCQRNSRTIKIKPNDRFLFGVPEQRIGFRVYAGGFGNSLNTITGDDKSPTLTQFYVEEYEMNYQTDDIENGFANAERFEYSIDISENNTYLDVGATAELNATVYRGKEVVDERIHWCSSNDEIVSIEDNKLTALAPGEVTLSAIMVDNKHVFGSITVTVLESSAEPNYDILINPDINYVLENEEIAITATVYKNGIAQDYPIEIVDISEEVPRNNYKIMVQGNTFTIINKKKFLSNPIKIRCSYNDIFKEFEFTLRGLY
jgi:hypothetical protein